MTAPMHPSELPLRARARLALADRAVPLLAAVMAISSALTLSAHAAGAEASTGLGVAIVASAALFVGMSALVWSLYVRLREGLGTLVAMLLTAATTATVATVVVWALPTCPRTGFEAPSRCTAPEAASWGLSAGLSALLGLLIVLAVTAGVALVQKASAAFKNR